MARRIYILLALLLLAASIAYALPGGGFFFGAGGVGPARANYFGDDTNGAVTFSGDSTFAVAADGDYVLRQFSDLTINAGVTVTTSNRCKGLFIYVTGGCTIEGTLTMSARGASAYPVAEGVNVDGLRLPMIVSGEGESLAASDFSGAGTEVIFATANQSGIDEDGIIFQIKRTGASGGVEANGAAGDGYQSGGGGGARPYGVGTGNDGAAGTCFSGGAGAGGANDGGGEDGDPWGGAGGDGKTPGSAGGGAGNPGGASACFHPGDNGTGGTIWLIVGDNLTLGDNAIVSADGSSGGGNGGCGTSGSGGGGSGGGNIIIVYGSGVSQSPTAVIRANGGAGGSGPFPNGLKGGNGSIQGPTKVNM